ncbi:4'-phosphopantetheinyl transferase family protein [Denitromonas iodatirespirans]|uniref:4'-phosphopantetheinyl transferase superfamily protein n=1 Tax=Denitromonas iodatirespirans TaxID=2795389 RepID=A0A944DAJ8_DENI1|nr:4'-phosphopantetheinyl transferase superfamily protein [Denitromonas iodatirespirans]MBT0963225.1 4'-phosphopantetheinyl transferase superfamily protein [Denitromonas iodatirespirans]
MTAPPALQLFIATTDALGGRTDLLSADELPRLQAMSSNRRRTQFCAGRALLRLALGHVRGLPPQPWPFMLDDGRPVLAGRQAPQLSLSHSGGHVACAISLTGRCGIDLQADTGRSPRGIADTFFAPADVDWLERQPDFARAFQALWVLKEAWAKASGEPLLAVLQGVRFEPLPTTPTPDRMRQVGTWHPSPTLSLGWAAERPGAAPTLLGWETDGFVPMAAAFTDWRRVDSVPPTMPNGREHP